MCSSCMHNAANPSPRPQSAAPARPSASCAAAAPTPHRAGSRRPGCRPAGDKLETSKGGVVSAVVKQVEEHATSSPTGWLPSLLSAAATPSHPSTLAPTLTRVHHCSRSLGCCAIRSVHDAAKSAAAMSPRTTRYLVAGRGRGQLTSRTGACFAPRKRSHCRPGESPQGLPWCIGVGVQRDGGAVVAQVVPGRLPWCGTVCACG